jgi:predicted transcriptional regulator
MPNVKGDRFGTFLERAKHYSSVDATSRETKAPRAENKTLDNILALLVDTGPLPVPELMIKVGLGAFESSRLLKILSDAQLVVFKEQSGQETVSLTGKWRKCRLHSEADGLAL